MESPQELQSHRITFGTGNNSFSWYCLLLDLICLELRLKYALLRAADMWFQSHKSYADSTQDLMWRHQGTLPIPPVGHVIFCKHQLHSLLCLIHTMNCEQVNIMMIPVYSWGLRIRVFKFPKPVSGEKRLTVEIPTPQLGNWVTLGALLTLSEPVFPSVGEIIRHCSQDCYRD